MQELSAVILDLDGLMIDTERAAREAWGRAASDFGEPMDKTLLTLITGRKQQDAKSIMVDAWGDEFAYEQIWRRRSTYLREAFERGDIAGMPGLEGLLETIEALELKVGIATSGRREATRLKLSTLGLVDRFETVVCGDDIKHGKPAPDIFLEAAHQLMVSPSQCVALEDSEAGARAAHAAGMRVIVVPEFKEPADDVKALAWRVVPSLHAAARCLAEAVEDRD